MSNITKLTATEILKISPSTPEKLFSRDDFNIEFKKLRGKWHPDVNSDPQANEVFVHLVSIAEVARQRINSDSWNGVASITFKVSNKTYRFKYRRTFTFELGQVYISSTKVLYVVKDNDDLFSNAIKTIKNINYPNTKFKQEFQRFMPSMEFNGTADIGKVVIFSKPAKAVLLQDLINYLPKHTIEPVHVAWIVSSLYNTTTFLDHIGICHNSILPSTIFVDMENHGTFVIGGWWYSTIVGKKLKALPIELLKIIPKKALTDKVSDTRYDRQAIKGTAIACLGDSSLVGSKLLLNKNIPLEMLTWLRTPSNNSAVKEFTGWYNTLDKIYGKRQFIKFDTNIDEIR